MDRDHGDTLIHPSFMSTTARLVIGLWSLGLRTPPAMADAVGMLVRPARSRHRNSRVMAKRQRFTDFAQLILDSEHKIVRDCLRNGLPRYCSTPLPVGCALKCRRCNSMLCAVPCVRCARVKTPYTEIDRDDMERPLRPCSSPTWATPGTPAKITVMRRRIELGEMPFHPSDPKLPVPIH